jgi:hypothetical protein
LAGGLVGQNYIPPALPISIQRLIGSGELTEVSVVYTASGAVTWAVLADGTKKPFHEWRSGVASEATERLLEEERQRFATRVADRKITGVVVPGKFSDAAEKQRWIEALTGAQRRLVTMTNREFRAQQGTDGDAKGVASKTGAKAPVV